MKQIKTSIAILSMLLIASLSLTAQTSCDDPHTINELPFTALELSTDDTENNFDETDACTSNSLENNEYVFELFTDEDIYIDVILSNTELIHDAFLGEAFIGLFITKNCPDDDEAVCIAKNDSLTNNSGLYEVFLEENNTYYIIVSSSDASQMIGGDVETSLNFDITVNKLNTNDVGVIEVSGISSGCSLGDEVEISCVVKNFALEPQSDFNIGISINGGVAHFENFSETINPDEEISFTFDEKFDFSSTGNYNIKVFTSLNQDQDTENDTTTIDIVHTPTISDLPHTEDFEDGEAYWTVTGTNPSWELAELSDDTNPEEAAEGDHAWVTNADGEANANENSFLTSPCYNLSVLEVPTIEFYMWRSFGLLGTCVLTVSTDGGETWTDTLRAWAGSNNSWEHISIQADDLANETNVRFRFNFESGLTAGAGVAIDNFTVKEAILNDLGVIDITEPNTACGLTDEENIKIMIYNYGAQAQSNIPVNFSIDGGTTWLDTPEIIDATIEPGDTLTYTFVTSADFSEMIEYEVVARTESAGDENSENDEYSRTITHTPTISNLPHTEDFEDGEAFWTVAGTNPSWELAELSDDTNPEEAAEGDHAWVTNPDGNANTNENSFLVSPCYNLSILEVPTIEFYLWRSFGLLGNSISLHISTDGGETWTDTIRTWTGSNASWEHVSIQAGDLTDETNVRFRFNYQSGLTAGAGVAIDNFTVKEAILNDLGVIDITEPTSACGLTDEENIRIMIYNYGAQAQSNIPVNFSIDGGTTWLDTPEIIDATIEPGDTLTYTFVTSADFSEMREYEVVARTESAGDENSENDEYSRTITHTPTISDLPHTQDFEDGEAFWTVAGTNPSWEHGVPNDTSDIDAVIGENAWLTNTEGNANTNENSFLISPCYNVSSLEVPTIEFYISRTFGLFGNSGALHVSRDGGVTWTDTLATWSGTSDGWQHVSISEPNLQNETNLRFRFNYRSGLMAGPGMAIDGFTVKEAVLNDLGVVDIYTPNSACGLTDSEQVSIAVYNYGYATQTNIPVNISIDGGNSWLNSPETIEESINPHDTLYYTFNTGFDFSDAGEYHIIVKTENPGDENSDNDEYEKYVISIPTISNYMYDESFEDGPGGWFAYGTNSSMVLGEPSATVINQAGHGSKAWVTNLQGFAHANELSYLQSPCFDFSEMENPIFSTMIQYETAGLDNFSVQYTTDGSNWSTLTAEESAVNWYGEGFIPGLGNNWNGNSEGWINASTTTSDLAGENQVSFRFRYSKGGLTGNNEGVAIDMIEVYDCTNYPVANFDYDVEGQTVNFNNNSEFGEFFYWTFGDGGLFTPEGNSMEQNPVYDYSSDGVYQVRLIVGNLCGTDTITQEVVVGNVLVNDNIQDVISVYPNPANSLLTISNNYGEELTISIINIKGQVLYTEPHNNSVINLDISNYPKGNYFIRIDSNSNQLVYPIVFK